MIQLRTIACYVVFPIVVVTKVIRGSVANDSLPCDAFPLMLLRVTRGSVANDSLPCGVSHYSEVHPWFSCEQ